MAAARIFGIDLGTTYSCIACVDQYGQPVVVRNSEGDATTPSVVFFEAQDSVIVGKAAKNVARIESDRVVAFVKRSMGDPLFSWGADGNSYNPQEISSFILRKLAVDACAQIGEAVRDVVITCPAYFGTNQVAATRDAGRLAGLNVLGVVREPVAAAISYGFGAGNSPETVLVFDLGGGTFDVSLISIKDNEIRVLLTAGDHELGGKDWDDRLTQYFATQFEQVYPGVDSPLSSSDTAQALLIEAEARKQELSSREQTRVLVQHSGQQVVVHLSRKQFEQLTVDLLDRTVELSQALLGQAAREGLPPPDRLLLVGGSSKMPAVTARLRAALGLLPELYDPDLAVAKGAALYANSLGLATAVREIIERQGDRGDSAVQEEAIREVAAARGVTGDTIRLALDTKVVMCSSKAFGVRVFAHADESRTFIDHLILANTPLPAAREATYYTLYDGQTVVNIEVYEQHGSQLSPEVADNLQLFKGSLTGIPPGMPRGIPILVTFRLSVEGLLQVAAREPSSGRELHIEGMVSGVMAEADLHRQQAIFAGIRVS